MARIDSAYDYFLTTYGSTIGSRYESHKKSELRDTYNSIIKANKESPLYKITQPQSTLGQFAIDIKENANSVAMSISNLTQGGDDISAVLDKRVAISSDEDALTAEYIGTNDASVNSFEIEVQSLATPQVNMGNFLSPNSTDFEEGQYSFDLNTRNNAYEFQYNVNAGDTNKDVQSKIMRLINTADVGLTAELATDKKGNNALLITSKTTGLNENESSIFSIESNTCWRELNTLGIGKITSAPTNSEFTLNGASHSSMSNTFTVNKAFELTIKQPTAEPVTVGLMADTDALSEGVNGLLDSYNGFLSIGMKYSGNANTNALYNEMTSIVSKMGSSLTSVGISADEDGMLSLDNQVLANRVNSSDRDETFSILNDFKDALSAQAKKASINPMKYVDKIVVEYKNPSKTLAFPYATSQYSGMLVDYGL